MWLSDFVQKLEINEESSEFKENETKICSTKLQDFDTGHEINAVSLIDGETDAYLKDTLYFGYYTQVAAKENFPAHCILAYDCDEDCPNSQHAIFVEGSRLFSLFNRALSLLNESKKQNEFYLELIRRAHETQSLDGLINVASARLGNALILLDPNFQILAYSTIYQVTDKLWQENIKQGYCNYEFISTVMEFDSIKNAPEDAEPIEVTCYTSPNRKISSRIYHGGIRVGTALMLEKDTIVTPEGMKLMRIVSEAAGEAISFLTPQVLSPATQYQSLLFDLLIGATQTDVKQRIEHLHFPAHMCALAITPARFLSKHHLHERVANEIRTALKDAVLTFYRDSIAVLVPLHFGLSLTADEKATLDAVAKAEFVQIGISNAFENISSFAQYFGQALKALDMGAHFKGNSSLFYYEDWLFHDLLDRVNDSTQLGRFCHPALSLLNRYDHKKGTDLYHTLQIHLHHSCNLKLTSAALYIHRNSLTYRLDRIIALTGIDLTDSYTRFLLYASYEIDRHSGLNQSANMPS
ncbi:helix-turn-helix domain-containing protein [Lachnospiraceae bacterium ZAX-1]